MRKFKFIILGIILISIICLAVAFFIDRDRMKNNLPVIFSTWGYSYAPPLEEVNNDQELDKDNTVVLMHGEVKNLKRLNEFIANTSAFAKKRIND